MLSILSGASRPSLDDSTNILFSKVPLRPAWHSVGSRIPYQSIHADLLGCSVGSASGSVYEVCSLLLVTLALSMSFRAEPVHNHESEASWLDD